MSDPLPPLRFAPTVRQPKTTAMGYQILRCAACRRTFNERTGTPFNFLEYPTDRHCQLKPVAQADLHSAAGWRTSTGASPDLVSSLSGRWLTGDHRPGQELPLSFRAVGSRRETVTAQPEVPLNRPEGGQEPLSLPG